MQINKLYTYNKNKEYTVAVNFSFVKTLCIVAYKTYISLNAKRKRQKKLTESCLITRA